jgi:hypothetical protein
MDGIHGYNELENEKDETHTETEMRAKRREYHLPINYY